MATSTTTNKFRYVANRAGRARHSVRAAACNRFSERRARSDAPYHVTEFPCHDTRLPAGCAGDLELLLRRRCHSRKRIKNLLTCCRPSLTSTLIKNGLPKKL